MKKIISPAYKAYRDKRDMIIIQMISSSALIGLGCWMLLDPSEKEHARVEKATTALVKEIWGMEAGIVCLVLGGAWLIYEIIKFRKFKKTGQKPEKYSHQP